MRSGSKYVVQALCPASVFSQRFSDLVMIQHLSQLWIQHSVLPFLGDRVSELFRCVEKGPHSGEVIEPGVAARSGQVDARLRFPALKPLLDLHISGIFQLAQMRGEVSVRCVYSVSKLTENGAGMIKNARSDALSRLRELQGLSMLNSWK